MGRYSTVQGEALLSRLRSLAVVVMATALAFIGLAIAPTPAHADTTGGTVKAWGWNVKGQLGNGTTTSSSTPVDVSGLTNVKAIAAGGWSGYALLSDGTVKAWGYNEHGELGNGTTTDSPTPVDVSGLTNVKAIAAANWTGYGTGYALLADGTVKAWGDNSKAQLGNGSSELYSPTPVTVSDLTNVKAIAAGTRSGYALLNDGTVKAWGWNYCGQLGDSTTEDRSAPVAVSGLTNVKAIAAGNFMGYALLNDGTVKAWGWNSSGQLGDGSGGGWVHDNDSYTPVAVTDLTNVKAIEAADNTGYALLAGGTVKAWGDNSSGQIGDGTWENDPPSENNRSAPAAVSGLSSVQAIAAGKDSGYALLEDDTVKAWGDNKHEQLGDGTTTDSSTPVAVSGLTNVTAIAAGGHTGYALVEKAEPNTGSVTTVTISGDGVSDGKLSLEKGGTAQLTATVLPANADDTTVTWTSSDTGVATVDHRDGTVQALNAGTVTITATSNGDIDVYDSIELTVTDTAEPAPTIVELDGGRKSVPVGGEVEFDEPDEVAGYESREITGEPEQGKAWLASVHYAAQDAVPGEYPFDVTYTMGDGTRYVVTYTPVVTKASDSTLAQTGMGDGFAGILSLIAVLLAAGTSLTLARRHSRTRRF